MGTNRIQSSEKPRFIRAFQHLVFDGNCERMEPLQLLRCPEDTFGQKLSHYLKGGPSRVGGAPKCPTAQTHKSSHWERFPITARDSGLTLLGPLNTMGGTTLALILSLRNVTMRWGAGGFVMIALLALFGPCWGDTARISRKSSTPGGWTRLETRDKHQAGAWQKAAVTLVSGLVWWACGPHRGLFVKRCTTTLGKWMARQSTSLRKTCENFKVNTLATFPQNNSG